MDNRQSIYDMDVAARRSSWLWAGSVWDRHYVGEITPVRVLKIGRVNVDRITIQVDARDVVYVRLNNGVNAIAHTCYDARTL